jgi:cobalt-zinc-cadmium efflux system membrane fusion protein
MSERSRPTILVVDDDEVLLEVLRRVLTQAGYDVLPAVTMAEALRQAESRPDLALLDLALPDGNGVTLAHSLHALSPRLPLFLMTAYPPRLAEHPELGTEFVRVLTKPMNLEELRQTLAAVLTETPVTEPIRPPQPVRVSPPPPQKEPAVTAAPAAAHHGSHHDLPEARRAASPFFKFMQSAGLLLIVFVVLAIFLGFVLGVRLPGMEANAEEENGAKDAKPRLGVKLVEGQAHTLEVPEQVLLALGIRKGDRDLVEAVRIPTRTRPLTMYGSTMLDPTKLVRIRARFAPCEVVEIGQHTVMPGDPGNKSGTTEYRELRPGDRVKKGDLLGVFFSVDVGSKKNDLLDALVQLELDQKIYEKQKEHEASIPQVVLLTYWRAVQGDRNAVSRALNNLKVWNIPQEEIDALHDEAKKISSDKEAWNRTPEGRWVNREKQANGDKYDPDKENKNPWGRVTLRAPFDGIIVERNVTVHEIVQDPTTNLFQIAQVNRLLVLANAPEDELPTLNKLMDSPRPSDREWTVRTVGAKSASGLKGPMEEVGYLIDPNQHTAIVKGYIDNPEEKIRAGQFVSTTVQVPPPEDVVEVPIDALVEDGPNCIVFVQTDAAKQHYRMRRVQPTHRFETTAFVRSTLGFTGSTTAGSTTVSGVGQTSKLAVGQKVYGPGIPADTTIAAVGPRSVTLSQAATATAAGASLEAEWREPLSAEEKALGLLPREPLRRGERILRSGAGELKAALLDLESRPAEKGAVAKGPGPEKTPAPVK